jgi:hypothetical protein
MNLKDITLDQLKAVMKKKKYAFFENGNFNLNIIGVRSKESESDKFDDFILVAYKQNNVWQLKKYEATTDPGKHYLMNPLNKNGTLILVPDQHKGAYFIGKHGINSGNPYEALQQKAPMKYVLDNSRDSKLDFSLYNDPKNIFSAVRATNLHRASKWKKLLNVGLYSAGCQVIQDPKHFEELMKLCNLQVSNGLGNSFTYTLLEEKDFLN